MPAPLDRGGRLRYTCGMEAIGRATHHIHVNGERLVLARAPREGEAPSLDEDGAGEQCEGCGVDAAELEWRRARGAFVCPTCGAAYSIRLGGYLGEG